MPADRQRVTSRVVDGRPVQVLLGAADGADVLVIGSRGRGAFTDAVFGSVGQYCLKHARGPVLIMRGRAAAQTSPMGRKTPQPATNARDRAGPR